VPYLVQRIIVNSYGWTKPSPGRLGPIGETEYVGQNGFGHEDWNFNFDLAIGDYIYGYTYYSPSAEKWGDQFSIAFATYVDHCWRLVGFYLDAEYAPPPSDPKVLGSKLKDIYALKSQNSLGKPWAHLDEERAVNKLEEETQYVHWKVHIKNVIRLPQPVPISARIFKSSNYRTTRPTEVVADVFGKLRSLASRAALPEDDDETAFPEGREVWLQHRARERNPAVIQATKTAFLRNNGRFFCQVCGFDFKNFYGEIGNGFIEAHHTTPVSELQPDSRTKTTDIALVCSNCHRMLHRRRPWITMADLKALLKSQVARA
jgi:hypothetical protein